MAMYSHFKFACERFFIYKTTKEEKLKKIQKVKLKKYDALHLFWMDTLQVCHITTTHTAFPKQLYPTCKHTYIINVVPFIVYVPAM